MNDLITTENLSKHYKDVLAVSDVSLHVRESEIYGFLGLNGAGKTTTIRMMLGMIKPSSGAAFINGKKVTADNPELWKDVGYLVEIPYSYPNLSVRENLEIVCKMRFIKEKSAIDRVMQTLQLTAYEKRKAKNLSLGNAQRLGLAKALLHNPKILILDEPTNGLDPAGIFEIRELLLDLAANHGVTIFISSHILAEISRFAHRIGIIHNGKLVQELDANQIEKECKKVLVLDTNQNAQVLDFLQQKGFLLEQREDEKLEIKNQDAVNRPEEIANLIVQSNFQLKQLHVVEEDLESYFLRTIAMKGGNK